MKLLVTSCRQADDIHRLKHILGFASDGRRALSSFDEISMLFGLIAGALVQSLSPVQIYCPELSISLFMRDQSVVICIVYIDITSQI